MSTREPRSPGTVSGAEAPAPPGELRPMATPVPQPGESPGLPTAAASSTPGLAGAAARPPPTAPTLPDFDPMALTALVGRLANELYALPPLPPLAPLPSPSLPTQPSVPPAEGPPAGVSVPIQTAPSEPFGRGSGGSNGPLPSTPTPLPHGAGEAVAPRAPAQSASSPSGMSAAPPEGNPGVAPPSPSPSPSPVAPMTPVEPSRPELLTSPFDAPLDFAAIGALGTSDPFAKLLAQEAFQIPLLDSGLEPSSNPARPSNPNPSRPVTATPNERTYSAYEITPTEDRVVRSNGGALLDPHALRREFPILHQNVNGKPLVWLDNAATTQKPKTVIDRLTHFYEHENSNIHRAAHTLAARATDAYESARESVRRFMNAPSTKDIIFVRGATEGINLVAQSWGRRNIREGDEIVLSWLEHHANIVPWQMLCSEKGARLRVAPVDDRGQIVLEEYEKLLGPKTRLVAFTQVSNALGTITPAKEMVEMAHRHGAYVLVDGAQSVSHKPTDVQALGCDFFVFSGHKVFAPTGIGAVFAKSSMMDMTPPWQGGGNMIQDVTFERTLYQPAPARFEAGTGNIADAVGLGAALDWLSQVGVERVEQYEHELLVYATERLLGVPGLTLVGTAVEKAGVLSFVLAGQKTEQVGGLLDQEGIAVRSGHHCAQPILRRFGLEATVRASLAPYNTREDIDALVAALHRLQAGHGRTS